MAGLESYIENNPKLILLWQSAYNFATQATTCILDNPDLIRAAHSTGNIELLEKIRPNIERSMRSALARMLEESLQANPQLSDQLTETTNIEDIDTVRRI